MVDTIPPVSSGVCWDLPTKEGEVRGGIDIYKDEVGYNEGSSTTWRHAAHGQYETKPFVSSKGTSQSRSVMRGRGCLCEAKRRRHADACEGFSDLRRPLRLIYSHAGP